MDFTKRRSMKNITPTREVKTDSKYCKCTYTLVTNPNQYIWGGEVRDKRIRSMTARPFYKY